MANTPVDLDEKLSSFSEQWAPKVVARLNDYEIKVVKLQGKFVWHSHRRPPEVVVASDRRLSGASGALGVATQP